MSEMQVDSIPSLPSTTEAPRVVHHALEFDLTAPTLLLLQRLGALPATPTAPSTTTTPSSHRNSTHLSSTQWVPLIPLADLVVLLSTLPPHVLPSDLPFPVQAAPATPASRQTLLDTLARLALEPSLTYEIMRRFRPLSVHLWGRWLEMLGLDDEGEWRASVEGQPEVEGERDAVEKVYRALVRLLPVFENCFPFLTTLLRHPLLATAPLPASSSSSNELATPLLTLHTLLHTLPHLPSSTHTATTSRLAWSFPTAVEEILKTHPHRGTRLVAWRILRSWYGLFASTGEDLRQQWVWKGNKEDQLAPMPDYPEQYKEEYERRFGAFQGAPEAEDVLEGWEESLVGESRLVEGGLEVLVKRTGADVWLLPVLEDCRAQEERFDLRKTGPVPSEWLSEEQQSALEAGSGIGTLKPTEISKAVVNVEGYLLFREGFLPSLAAASTSDAAAPTSSLPTAPSTTAPSLSPAPEPFIRTPTTTTLLRSLALHVQRRLPVLITSPPSSGKQSAITHLWSILHASPSASTSTARARRRGLVVINLADRSLDSKSLLGSLSSAPTTSTSTAGTFTFIEGPLTRALRQGRWVVLTSIDQASVEVLTVIKIVVERMARASAASVGGSWGAGASEEAGGVGVRVGGGEGRWVRAGAGFMLFATRSVNSETASEPTFFTSDFWSEVRMDRLGKEEVGLIVNGRFERLEKAGLAQPLIETWEKVGEVKVKEGIAAGTVRPVGVRDLMRWCRRVEGLLPRDVIIKSIESNPTLQEEIFTEARDVFLGSMPVPPPSPSSLDPSHLPRDRYSVVSRVIAEGLHLSPERAEWVLRRRVPEFVEPIIDEADGIVSKRDDYAIKIGRVSLPYRPNRRSKEPTRTYAHTNPSLIVLEKLAVCLRLSEPVLMVGETGTGKTAAVGHLAEKMGKRLTALNLSNQTEAGDLVGGFRPIDEVEEARRTASELVNRFVQLFGQTFSLSRNAEFVNHVRKAFDKKRWQRLVGLWREASRMAADRIGTVDSPPPPSTAQPDAPRKRRKVEPSKSEDLPVAWRDFGLAVGDFDLRHVQKAGKSKFVFSFVEGPLAKAIRDGDWVLLDEVNLASAETLESLSTLLQAPDSSLILTEQGDLEPIPRHPEFRLFACMNPATDVGKRDLPAGLRSKFSEIWVPPPDEDRDALVKIVEGYIQRQATNDLPVIGNVADLYSAVKALAVGAQLADGANHPPHFSMRTLARALTFAAEFAETFGSLRRALYEGFLMSFTMLLDPKSQTIVNALIKKHIVEPARNAKSLFKQNVKKPSSNSAIFIEPYWLETGEEPTEVPTDYILTPSVQRKVCDLARAVLTRKVPVLIQGPTSAGKTSVVEYLAKRTGHRFVRINNHEHTDIQEYVGTYVSDPDSGKLVFQEGVLVRALRRGDWIVLDELNLAPTDVLEALNRLLDDNRELVIPETGEVVRPHPHFMLFATQNPPGLYGGRKVLSRAFRNRFLEMHFGDVPQDELETILCERCRIAPSYAKKTVAVFLELQRRRQAGRVFEQKHAFATLRDLFRWGGRGSVGYQQLAEDGYMLLAERARRADDKEVVKDVIEMEMKVKIDETTIYDFENLVTAGLPDPRPRRHEGELMDDGGDPEELEQSDLVWTSAMRRLYFLIAAALARNEPVLLVGETGSGKTSVCQALALALSCRLHVVGCHQNTETADLLGGQRPLRNRASLQAALRQRVVESLVAYGQPLPDEDGDFEDLVLLVETLVKTFKDDSEKTATLNALLDQMRKTTALFEWHDGPLVQAMHSGDLILLDEISLADDSVLERLNSVLEPSRTLVLAEKGGRDLEDIRVVGSDGFQILATMNPGGDFGKKELSPALRNRFTEIWVPGVDNLDDLRLIIRSRWDPESIELLDQLGEKILAFAQWFGAAVGAGDTLGIGLRDILGWIDFLNKACTSPVAPIELTSLATNGDASSASIPQLALADAFCQGALMTVVDGLGALPATSSLSKDGLERLKTACWRHLETLVTVTMAPESVSLDVVDSPTAFAVGPFGVAKGALPPASVAYTLLAPTTRLNAMRLLRALQLKKPVLLEGSPGVGKTSLVTALAAATGHHLVRINLSDQTDLMDLLGSDLPVEGGRSGEFAWKDAPFLAAMQQGDWVLLDEMNLASQAILEGLNSCLDHRGTVFIPELDRTFVRHPDFRIFAAQNPLGQGGGRKGLPKSFLDRFSLVHMEELNSTDLNAIAAALFPDMDPSVVRKMIEFNSTIHRQTMESRSFGMEGSPWEFNLRDVLRWLSLVQASTGLDLRRGEAIEYVGLLYLQRFRNIKDRTHVAQLFAESFSDLVDPTERPWPFATSRFVQVGHSLVNRSDASTSGRTPFAAPLLQRSLQPFEALTKCLDMGWLAILTGPRSSGKTTLVRQVAAFAGRTLREFSMSAEVDTLELLGSFEQAERFREIERIATEALALVQQHIQLQLSSASATDLHTSLVVLDQLRRELGVGAPDVDLEQAAFTIEEALKAITSEEASQRVDDIQARLQVAVSSVPTSARFEWIDGPLVQAMKKGDWLLIEDANLCSPSVLDRLNSLFEPGGRLQLAERGPVDGEIQIILPHPDFRLVMSLDPRNGELSRAMRNRGIEIALLPNEEETAEDQRRLRQFSRSSTSLLDASAALHGQALDDAGSLDAQTPTSFNDPDLDPILSAVSSIATGQTQALAQLLVCRIAPLHYGLALRFFRSFAVIDASGLDSCMRELQQHAIVQSVDELKQSVALARGVPASLIGQQATDLTLTPLAKVSGATVLEGVSIALDALTTLLLAPSSQPEALRVVSAKSVRSLNVWEKSLLASHGKLRLDDASPALLSLFPVNAALRQLVGRIASLPLSSMDVSDQMAVARGAKTLQSLAAELEHICDSPDLDFSSIQHIAAWIAVAMEQLPRASQALAEDAQRELAPLRSSLALTSGKAMSEIWRTCLPFQPASGGVADAYHKLVARGLSGTAEAWDQGVVDLFLDVAIALGIPQPTSNEAYEAEAPELVERLLLRLPAAATDASQDPSIALSAASNAASVAVAELAAVANVFGLGDKHLAASTLVRVAHKSGVIPLASIVPVHQLVSWPTNVSEVIARTKSSVEFRTLLTWSEHLALGVDTSSSTSPADVVRPSLLRAVVALRTTDNSNLGNLVVLADALARAASLQAWTAASDSASRVASLGAALLASIALTVNGCRSDEEASSSTTFDASSNLADLLSSDRQLSPALAESVDLHLAKSLPSLGTSKNGLAAIGNGFVAFARCFWFLYLPNLPLDPAVGLRAQSGFINRQLSSLTDMFSALEAAEQTLTGNGRNRKMERIATEITALRQQLETAAVVPVTREGNPALLSSLFQELRSFQEQIISDNQLDTLLVDLSAPATPELVSREANLQRSIETLLRRLKLAYSDLGDILDPVRLSLCALKIGFSLLLHVAQTSSLPPSATHFSTLLHHLTSFPTVAHTPAIEAVDLPLSIKVGEAPLPPARATLLQVAALSGRLVGNAVFDRDVVHRLTQLYDRLHYLWSADKRHEEEAEREAQSLYKSKTDVQQVASDEELEAQEFAKLFPSFEEPTTNDDPVVTASNGVPTPTSVPRLLQPTDQAALARLHTVIFANAGPVFSSTSAREFDALRSASVTALLPKLFDSLDEALDRDSAVYRIRSLVELSQAAAPSVDVEAPHHDFYNEPDVRETAKAVPILLALSTRLGDLIVLWPDQMVLHNLRERCQAVLALSSKSSIAQVLTALEQLLSHTEDWESYASREHSIGTDRTAIINLIVEWRRHELTCWSRLLTTIQDRFGDPVAEWWFRFYETTIRGAPGVDVDPDAPPSQTPAAYYSDLVALLNSFLASSSLGQYKARLELVLSFANFAAKLGEKSIDFEEMPGAESLRTVSELMLNVYAFYDQFTPRITTFLTSERARIDKDVQNLIKLASWKDVNVYALRQSAIRSHHALYKSVRKLRAVLQKPASDYFTLPDAEKTVVAPLVQGPFTFSLDLSTPLPDVPVDILASTAAPHLARLDQTLARLSSLTTSTLGPFVAVDRATTVDDLAVEIITTSKALKAESKPGPEEGREQRVKALATRKRRAWIELLRELKRLGLSPTPSPDVVARLQDPGFVYSLPSTRPVHLLDSSLLPETLRNQLRKADDYHYRLLSELPALRACPAAHNDDISTREVQRAIGSIESSISMGFEHRTQLVAALGSHAQLEALAQRLTVLGESATPQATLTSKKLAETLLDRVSRLGDAFAEASVELSNHRLALGKAAGNLSTIDVALNGATSLLASDQSRLQDLLAPMASFDPVLSTPDEIETFTLAQQHLTTVVDQLSSFSCPPSLQYLVAPLTSFATSLDIPVILASTTTSASLESLEAAHNTFVDSVLVVAQELKKLADKDVKIDSEAAEVPDLAIKLAGRSLQETLAVLRVPELLDQLDSFVRLAHSVSATPSAASSGAALLARVAPFLRLLSDLIARHLGSFLEWHKASLKLSFVLSSIVQELSAQGFCRPSEDDGKGGEEADGKTTDGTGMADGQGAKNVSKDIEDESQIEGLEGDVEQEKDKDERDDQDGDDDAVEMSMDFEGDMEDRGDGEKDKDEDGDSDDESQPDPEEQVADVDPLDPSSVDEKFWGDEESKEESKEGANEEVNQETTKSAGDSEMAAKDDQAAAPEPKGEAAEDAAKEEESKEEKSAQENGTELDDDAEGDDDDGTKEDGEDDEAEGDAVPQADDAERLDDRMPEADNLDLPDDMNLDGEDKKEDDLDLDSDMGSLNGDPEDGENDNQPDELDEMGDPKDQEAGDEDPLLAENETPLEPDGPEPPSEEQPSLDQSLGGAQEGETGGEGEQDSSSAKPEPANAADSSKQPGAQAEADESAAPERAVDESQADQDAEMDDSVDDAAPSNPSNSADGQSKQRSSTSDPTSDPSRSRPNNQGPAEPQRSLGDTLQSWRRRLEEIADMTDSETPKAEADPTSASKEGEVEYVQEGDETEQDDQALGPATEEQVKGLESLRLGEDETPTSFEPDTMDVDDSAPTLPQPSSTVQLDGSSLAESDAKAIPAAELRDDRTQAEQDQDDVDDEILRDDEDGLPSTTLAPAVDLEADALVEETMLQWRSGEDSSLTAEGVWRLYESLTRDLSYALTEQLRLILEPTLATRLQGDYRSGKRLNLKKIIPYIASEFTKDKIWLRRTRPSQREYQVLIAIDDSKSMADSHSVHLAYQTLALVTRALTRLEVGGVSICRFGDTMDVLHPFEGGPVSDEAGATLLGKFSFSQRTTDVRLLVERSLAYLALAKESARSGKTSLAAGDLWQLQIIISDGMCQDHEKLRALLRRATEQKVMFVFVVIDSLHRRANEDPSAAPASAAEVNQNSILAMKSVSYTKGADGRLELKMTRYLDAFPFDAFVVLRDVEALPEVLSSTLRQFFERVSSDR